MPNTKEVAIEILAKHGVECEVSELIDLIDDHNAVLRLKYCLEAVEYALSNPLEQSEKKEEWVSCKDQMPEFDIPVLVYCPIYGRYIATHVFIGEIGGEKFGNWHDGKVLGVLPPIYWKYLPNPPKNLV